MAGKIDLKKIVLSGLIAGFAAFMAGNILYMNPFVAGLYTQYADYPCSKPMDSFGGLGNWLFLMMLGGLASTVFLAAIYSYAEKALDVKPAWKKGALFGLLFWLAATVPAHYYTWLMYTYPDALNLVELLNGLIGGLVAGIVLAMAYERL
jgi:uncharacterized BrkB/YihY/UPF0761 family membrane protein